jgi:hypothetical protein
MSVSELPLNLLEIVATLMQRWKELIVVDRDIITKMLNYNDQKPESNLWKMTAI